MRRKKKYKRQHYKHTHWDDKETQNDSRERQTDKLILNVLHIVFVRSKGPLSELFSEIVFKVVGFKAIQPQPTRSSQQRERRLPCSETNTCCLEACRFAFSRTFFNFTGAPDRHTSPPLAHSTTNADSAPSGPGEAPTCSGRRKAENELADKE